MRKPVCPADTVPDPAAASSSTPRGHSLRRGRPSMEQSAAITSAIIAAATRMFIADGFEGTAMEAVAASVGIPKTTLYKRFGDKHQLLDAVLRERVRAWSRVASRRNAALGPDLAERLRHHVATMMAWGCKPEVRAVMRLAASAASQPGGLPGGQCARQGFFGYDRMVTIIATAIAELGPAQGIHARDPHRVARTLMHCVSGWLEGREPGEAATPQDIAGEAAFVVDLVMHGKAAW